MCATRKRGKKEKIYKERNTHQWHVDVLASVWTSSEIEASIRTTPNDVPSRIALQRPALHQPGHHGITTHGNQPINYCWNYSNTTRIARRPPCCWLWLIDNFNGNCCYYYDDSSKLQPSNFTDCCCSCCFFKLQKESPLFPFLFAILYFRPLRFVFSSSYFFSIRKLR